MDPKHDEQGEAEMEEGEFELDEASSNDEINYHEERQSSSSDEEEDIIGDYLSKKKERPDISGMEPPRKKQKTETPEDGAALKMTNKVSHKEMGDVKALMGKDAAAEETLQVDFEYVAPSEPYWHIVRQLLGQFLDGPHQEKLAISAMADHILERASIGSVIVSSLGKEDPEVDPQYKDLPDDEFDKVVLKMNAKRDVYGFATILSLSKYKESLPWMKVIFDYSIEMAQANCLTDSKRFIHVLNTLNVGLLVSERLVNMPASVVPHLHGELPEDLEFTKEQDDIDDPKEFEYKYVLILTKFTIPSDHPGLQKTNFQPERKDRIYYKWEDDVFDKKAEVSFSYQTTFKEVGENGEKTYFQGVTSQAGGGQEVSYRLIMLLKWEDYVKCLPVIQKIIG